MKKKHYVKTIEDIKYCEGHKRLIAEGVYSDTYKFEDGVWNRYDSDGNLDYYAIGISITDDLYYYEEESEEQTEATEEDVGKLCWFWDDEERKYISKLTKTYSSGSFRFEDCFEDSWKHCRPLTKEEIKEFMEKAE